MAGIKIVDLPALGRDLISTDLLEVSLNGSGSRKITGQEIMNASKLAVGSTPIVSGTVGRLLFQNTGDVLGQSGNLFWDNTNGRLGIGTSSPITTLDVRGQTTIALAITDNNNAPLVVQNLTSYSSPFTQFIQLWKNSAGITISSLRADGSFTLNGTVNATTITATSNGNGTSLLAIGRGSAAGFWFPSGTMLGINTNGSERARVTDTGNVLINTTTDAGFRLDVNGTARVSGAVTIGDVGGGAYDFQIRKSTSVVARIRSTDTNSSSIYEVQNNLTNYVFLTARGSTASALGFTQANEAALYASIPLNITTAFSPISIGVGASRSIYIPTSNNVLINTTTDAGYKLDVNGTARIKAQGALSTDIAFRVRNSADTLDTIQVRGDGVTNFNLATGQSVSFTHGGGTRINLDGVSVAYKSGNRNTFGGSQDFLDLSTVNSVRMTIDNNGRIGIGTGLTAPVSSAQLQIDSTNRGFLPPRMTNAQRAAIASPAVGLIVYCTDSTEGLYVYKSTGWTFMV